MARRPVLLTPIDVALLRAIDREGSVAGACRSLGIARDRGVYRIARLARRLPTPVLRPRRGGSGRGSSRLTPAARALLDGAPETREVAPAGPSVVRGVYRTAPEGHVSVGGTRVYVDFAAEAGEPVRFRVDPEAVVVALDHFVSSARNVWPGVVRKVPRGAARAQGRVTVIVEALGRRLPVALTRASLEGLGLVPGRRVYLYAKATAIRRA